MYKYNKNNWLFLSVRMDTRDMSLYVFVYGGYFEMSDFVSMLPAGTIYFLDVIEKVEGQTINNLATQMYENAQAEILPLGRSAFMAALTAKGFIDFFREAKK